MDTLQVMNVENTVEFLNYNIKETLNIRNHSTINENLQGFYFFKFNNH